MEYAEWRNFALVIERAKIACEKSEIQPTLHFVDVNKSYKMPNGGFREIGDIALTRYACYLIAQNGDPAKEVNNERRELLICKLRRFLHSKLTSPLFAL